MHVGTVKAVSYRNLILLLLMAIRRPTKRKRFQLTPVIIDLTEDSDPLAQWLASHPPPPPETSVLICPPGVPRERAVSARSLAPHELRQIAREANTRELLRILCRPRRAALPEPYAPPPPALPPDLTRNILKRYRDNTRDHDIAFAREILQRRKWEREYRRKVEESSVYVATREEDSAE